MRMFLHTVACVTLLGVGSVSAQPQTESLSGNAGQIWHGAAAGASAGQWLDLGAVSSGDSRSDLIIGAPGSPSLPGNVYVIFGGPVRTGDVNLSSADTILTGAAAGDRFGWTTAAGNVITPESSLTRNLVVAAPGALGGKGAVYVFMGGFTIGSSLTTANATFTIVGRAGDQLGTALATADLDNDGFREIIIGAGGNDRMYVIKGGAALSGTRDLTTTLPDLEIAGVGIGDVMAAGDVTGDGISDLLVGSAETDSSRGIVYLFKGKATGGIPNSPDAAFGGIVAGDRAGASLRLLDIDHDGIRDIMVGAPGTEGPGGRTDSGAVYLIWGSSSLVSRALANSDVTFYGATAGMQLGTHISAGDINRDTPSDIVMMAPGLGGSAGELDVYYGRSVRTQYGVDAGGGRRVVDFADQTQIDRKIVGDPAVGSIAFTQVFEVTGEGARDIVATVPSQSSGAGAVYFTLSPSLVAGASAIPVVVNRGSTSASSPVAITNRSIIAVTWSAAGTQPWLSSAPASGSTTSSAPGQLVAVINATSLAAGSYSGTLNVSSTSKHLEMTVPIGVNLTVTDLRGAVEAPAAGSTVRQPFVMSGWAIDPSSVSGTGVDQVQIWAFRNDGSAAPGVMLGMAAYGSPRTDIGATYGSRFTNSGFSIRLGRLAPGPYRLVAYPRNAATGTFPFSAQTTVTILPAAAPGSDVDGDFISDLTLYKANGDWAVRTSSSGFASTITKSWGGASYTPLRGDFDGDGKLDFGVYRRSTGDWFVLLSGSGYASTISKAWGGPAYQPVAADYDGDGKIDLAVYRASDAGWFILTSSSGFTASISAYWGGSGYVPVPNLDFDGDGRADITAYNPLNGIWYVLKSSGNYTTAMTVTFGGGGTVLVAGDFDGDGKADVGFYNRGSGRWSIAKSSTGYATVLTVFLGGGAAVAAPGDYDGDGILDPAAFSAATGTWSILTSSSGFSSSIVVNGFGAPGDKAMSNAVPIYLADETTRATDVDGDGRADLTVYNPATATWYTLQSGANYTTTTNTAWGGSGYTPVPGDFDGDGRADRVVYQASTGNWYVLLSSTNFTTSLSAAVGGPGWTPALGDYDGDGKTDFVVYNASTGQWYGLKSSTNFTTTVNVFWGGSGYTATPGDFDGDGKADLGVYQPASGNWFVLLSAAGYTTSLSKHAGGAGFVPVQGDYDGDGMTDFVAYNPSTAMWTGLKSSTNYTATLSAAWGGSGYTPVKGDFDGDGRTDIAVYQASSGNWYVLLSSSDYTTTMIKAWGGTAYSVVPTYP
jgi:FG-GAP-like repeat/FG-GAP repeat